MTYLLWGQRYRFFRIDLKDPFCQLVFLEPLRFQELAHNIMDLILEV